MEGKAKTFDVNNKMPKVLLVGNGLLTSTAEINGITNNCWSESVYNLANKKLTNEEKDKLKYVPYGLVASVIAPDEDAPRHDAYQNEFKTKIFTDDSLLRDLVSLGFDAILTTNYTYEIENCFYPQYSKLKDKRKFARTIKRSSSKGKSDNKYQLHTYNEFPNAPPIWHIHGELRKKSSIILNHDEYARLINRLIDENQLNKNKYVDFATDVIYKSWLDYFLMSDLYIVGLGLDFSEFDLWWILNRRMREKAKKGKIVFFAPKDIEENKKYVLDKMGVSVEIFGNVDPKDYIGLYKEATEYLKNEIQTPGGK